MEEEGFYEISVPPSQFGSEPSTALKEIKSFKKIPQGTIEARRTQNNLLSAVSGKHAGGSAIPALCMLQTAAGGCEDPGRGNFLNS